MGAAARLSIETVDLDQSQAAVECRRGSDRHASDQPVDLLRLGGIDVDLCHGEPARDHGVDRCRQSAQAVVVDFRQIEVHPTPSVAGDLGPGHERAGELVEHERVEHVADGVQRGDAQPMLGVDRNGDITGQLGHRVGEHMPPGVAVGLDTDHLYPTVRPLDRAAVADLPAPARMKCRTREGHRTGSSGDDHGLVLVQVWLVVTQIDRHVASVGRRAPDQRAESERAPTSRRATRNNTR